MLNRDEGGDHMSSQQVMPNGRVTEEVTMTQDARPSGASIRQRVFGEANVQRKAPGDPFLVPFFETAIEHVWGGVWNRPGLELKYRSLVVVSVLAATGHANEELKTHLRGAREAAMSDFRRLTRRSTC